MFCRKQMRETISIVNWQWIHCPQTQRILRFSRNEKVNCPFHFRNQIEMSLPNGWSCLLSRNIDRLANKMEWMNEYVYLDRMHAWCVLWPSCKACEYFILVFKKTHSNTNTRNVYAQHTPLREKSVPVHWNIEAIGTVQCTVFKHNL